MLASDLPNPFEAPSASTDSDLVEAEDGDWSGPPWEEPGNPIRSFVRTVVAVLVRPNDMFRRMRPNRGFNPAGTFGIWAGSLGLICFVISSTLYRLWTMPEQRGSEFGFNLTVLLNLTQLVFVPFIFGTVLTLVGSAIGVSLLHLALRTVGGARRSMLATFRAFAYSLATFTAWGFVPLVGLPIGAIHFVIVVAIGLAKLHGISVVRAIAAEILAIFPPILLIIAAFYLSPG